MGMIGEIFQDGGFSVTYLDDCPGGCEIDGGECVLLHTLSQHIAHWHLRRFWFRRPRSVAECVVLAMYAIQELRLSDARERATLDGAKDFARQLISDGLLQ